MELFRVVEGNQPQALPAAGHQQAFTRQQVALGAAVRTGKAAVAVFGISDNFQMAVSRKHKRRGVYIVRTNRRQDQYVRGGVQDRPVTTTPFVWESRIGPPAENEYAVEPVGVARIMPSLR